MTGGGGRTWTVWGIARARRARLWILGVSAVYAAAAAGLALTVPERYVRWALAALVSVALCAYLPLSRFINRRPVAVTMDGRLLRLGRFGSAAADQAALRGVWFDRRSGVGLGTAIHLYTDQGRVVRVGGRGVPTSTGMCTAPPTQSVDITLAAADLGPLLAALGMESVDTTPLAEVEVALYEQVNRGRSGCLRLALPILVLYVVALGGGGVMFLMSRWVRPEPRTGFILSLGFAALVLVAVVATIWMTQRSRPTPTLTLVLHAGGCTMSNRRGQTVAAGRPTWRRLRYSYPDLSGRIQACPVVELILPSHPPFTVGSPDPELAWRGSVPETSAPRYLVGAPDWGPLLAALDRFGASRT